MFLKSPAIERCNSMNKVLSVLGFAACGALLAMAVPAHAKIRCDGPYQIISGAGPHLTPYCEIQYLYKVARGYGISTSFAKLRNNVSERERVCRAIGHDGRVQNTCVNYLPDGGNRKIR